ncbi:MAG: hypothetical protein IKP47_11870 [Ruminococcus sp.]|nr:hypothetical protein [Ruminococcus sp.]
MRRILGYICYAAMLGAYGAAGIFTYRAMSQKISYEQGLLTFVPLFIGAYWFSTFFGQLMIPQKGEPLMPRRAYKILNILSTVLGLALIGVWTYFVIDKKLYQSI